jgi:uncharacterized protein (UPF0276 family)
MSIALSAGLSLKPEHYAEAHAASADGLWFEVHPENYMVDGGPRLAWLAAIAERHPVSLHGVALSLAADAPPDEGHLQRLRSLVERVEPALVSEHLAWSAWRGAYHPDLLPFPRTEAALARITENVDRTQEVLGRAIAVENPTHYLVIEGHEYEEIDFLGELARRTGCGLLLDVNNVFLSANNLGFSAEAYLDAFPGDLVREIHLGRPRGRSPVGRRPPDRQPQHAGLRPGLGALRPADRAHRSPPDADRAGRRPAPVHRADGGARPRRRRAAPPPEGRRLMTPTAPSPLGRFQDGFTRALISIEPPAGLSPEMDKVARQIAFSVYRNTVLKGWIDALKANFPAVDKLVGDEWFDLAAAVFARHHPPREPMLGLFGEGFPAFLDGFEPARETPYLSAVARLDRFWSEAHAAPDADPASPEDLAQLDPQRLAGARAILHPSARVAWFEHTAPTIWLEARGFIAERESLDFEQVGEAS